MSTPKTSPTMIFLRNAIEESPKTQREIARDAGFPNPNALSMMKTGECKVPISRIPALAEALEIGAGLFLKTALRESHSEIWMTIEEYMRPKCNPIHEEILYAYDCACVDGPIPWSQGLEVLSDERPVELGDAYQSALGRGDACRKRVAVSLERMPVAKSILQGL